MAATAMAFDVLGDRDLDFLRQESKSENAPLLRCAECGQGITDPRARTERGGQHEHRCENPLGIGFGIGCFAWAPGCAELGDSTEEHTWFPGYAWRVVVCRGCARHLGWRFQSPGDRFFGLILSKLQQAP